MALTLNARKGADTLRKLEAAAIRRHAEAMVLVDREPLGAIYLHGYAIEMRLKCAYHRLERIPLGHDLNSPLSGNTESPFQLATKEIKRLLGAGAPRAVGHHLQGWASLVIAGRSGSGLKALDFEFRDELLERVKNVSLCWSEILRYRANKPYDSEVKTVAGAAHWLKDNYKRLWK